MPNFIKIRPERDAIQLPVPEGYILAATGISYRAEVLRLWVPDAAFESVFGRTERQDLASFPISQAQNPYTARVSVSSQERDIWHNLFALTATFPFIQTLPGDRIIVVGSRCTRSSDGTAELNASIHRADGSVEVRFCLGDGIQHVQVDSEGRLWVGYFDEGVYGNFGWGFFGNDLGPIGQAGLVLFSDTGEKQCEFTAPQGFGGIDDCYALSVADNGAWLCYYSDFPIAHMDARGQTSAWRTDLSGPRQIAVSGSLVLAFGGYEGQRTDCNLIELKQGNTATKTQTKLLLPEGINLASCTVRGRGSFLHIISGDTWHTFRVPQNASCD